MKSVTVRRYGLAGLAAALLLTSSLAAVSAIASRSAMADEASDEQAVRAFFDYGYGVCDAEVLSAFWEADFWDTKVWAGYKVVNGDHDLLADNLAAAYGSYYCGQMGSLGYDDSMTLAALWSAPTQA